MVQYLCGTELDCGTKENVKDEPVAVGDEDMKKTDWAKTARATEKAKINILKNYYMVGILGKFCVYVIVLTAPYHRYPPRVLVIYGSI